MNKKIILINIIVIILVAAVYISGIYFINYPAQFDLPRMAGESGLLYLLLIFAVTALVAFLISSLNIKNLSFKNKFVRVFPALNLMVLIFFVYHAAKGFSDRKKELAQKENYYIREAAKDIQNDKVSRDYGGGFFIPSYDRKTMNSIDSVRRQYGIFSNVPGCTVEPMDRKAYEKYTQLTDAYLEKRNGKDWKKRMDKELKGLKKTKNPQGE
ncbi:MAG: hypothetical protein LBE92_05620 [Chryseobacterium sp.]|jgi:hypothetical protein|uniref:FEKKY domain-containing protein n=1 Tax=Chryseobacterium sp. TaxID=1871047 RepID=UPI0028226C71|nr:hypothetical protein [Chryseobacterium sp.]MDR2235581.1 hypothetical protein [Chryseobacterium sp.]